VKWQCVIPASLTYEILKANHDDPVAGHLAFKRTFHKIRERYWWKDMKKDIQHWVESCRDCGSRRTPNDLKAEHMEPIPVGDPFQTIGMDFIGPLPRTKKGMQYILVITEYVTKWAEAFATEDCTAMTVAKILVEEFITRHGAPAKIITDRGKHFKANLIADLCRLLGIEQNFTTAYHPQTNGMTERFNKTLATMLSKYAQDTIDNWDEMIPYVLFAYRTSLHESTLETPFYLTYGRDPTLPIDVALRFQDFPPVEPNDYRLLVTRRHHKAMELAKQNIERAQRKYQEYYKKTGVPREFSEGDQVWIYSPVSKKGVPRKFAHLWIGPFRIIEKFSPINYKIRRVGGKQEITTVHINRMKKFIDPNLRPIEPPTEWPIDKDSNQVEAEPETIEEIRTNEGLNPIMGIPMDLTARQGHAGPPEMAKETIHVLPTAKQADLVHQPVLSAELVDDLDRRQVPPGTLFDEEDQSELENESIPNEDEGLLLDRYPNDKMSPNTDETQAWIDSLWST
jgi:hypothetical protein